MTDTMRRVTLLAVISAVAGLLIAGVASPVVGMLSYVTDKGAETWESQSCGLASNPQLPQRTRIVAADGSTIADFYYQNRTAVGIDEIAPVMREAIIAIEDARFYEHNGLDPKGTVRALVTNGQSGQIRQGGSTLTQQYVKNLFLLTARTRAQQRAAVADTFERKLREARCALQLERKLDKDEILAGYLNIALFGPGIYGVEAAAEHYFGRHAGQLTLPQAALLAGLVRNPSGYDPARHAGIARDRRNVVLQRMSDLGFVSARRADAAARSGLHLHLTTTHNGCEASRAPYFCEWILDVVKSDPAFGETRKERINTLLRGGLTIRTTLDWKTQRIAHDALVAHVPPSRKRNPRHIAAASVVVEPGTGAVKAMAVSLPFGNGKGRNANNLATGGSRGFQAGSTFKLFTLVAALQQGIPATFRMHAPARYCSPVFVSWNCAGNDGVGNAGDSEAGTFTLLQATAASVNTYFVQLEERVGVSAVVHDAEQMGIDFTAFPGWKHPTAVDGAVTLGAWGVSPLEMAGAYATIAARGKFCRPYGVSAASTGEGARLPVRVKQCRQAIDRGVADTTAQILTHVIAGPGSHTGGNANIGRPAAGKTGTTNDYGAAWFDGFTPQLAAAVWVGDPRGPAYALRDFTIDGRYWTHQFGGDLPAMIWAQTMRQALKGVPAAPFPAADPEVEFGQRVYVPSLAGRTPDSALSALRAAGLEGEVASTEVHSTQPAGTVAYGVPGSGARVPVGTLVRIYLSDGTPPPTPTPSATSPSPSQPPTPTPGTTPTILPTSPRPSPTISPVPLPSKTKRHPRP